MRPSKADRSIDSDTLALMKIAPTLTQAFSAAGGALIAGQVVLISFLLLTQMLFSGGLQSISAEWLISATALSAQLVAPVVLTYGVGSMWLLGRAGLCSLPALGAANAVAAALFSYYATFDPETATFGLGGGFGILLLITFAYAGALTLIQWLILARFARRTGAA